MPVWRPMEPHQSPSQELRLRFDVELSAGGRRFVMTRSLSAERAEKRQAALERLRSRRGSRIRAPKEWKSTTDFFAHRLEPFLRQREGGDSASAEEVKTVFEEARKKSKAKRTDQRAETSGAGDLPDGIVSGWQSLLEQAGTNNFQKTFSNGWAGFRQSSASVPHRLRNSNTSTKRSAFGSGLWRPCSNSPGKSSGARKPDSRKEVLLRWPRVIFPLPC